MYYLVYRYSIPADDDTLCPSDLLRRAFTIVELGRVARCRLRQRQCCSSLRLTFYFVVTHNDRSLTLFRSVLKDDVALEDGKQGVRRALTMCGR